MSLHRLFVALRPPPEIRAMLIAHMHGITGARWQDDDQLHITLRFIGEVDHHRAEDVAAALGSIRHPPVEARIAGLGSFARRDVPHSLWAGIAPAEPVAALARKVETACVRAGLSPETRAFQPHITLARLNRSAGPVAPFMARVGDLGIAPFRMDAMILYESELTREAARYHPVARYPLR